MVGLPVNIWKQFMNNFFKSTVLAGLVLAGPAFAEEPKVEMKREDKIEVAASCHALQIAQSIRYRVLGNLLGTASPSSDEAAAQVRKLAEVSMNTSQAYESQGRLLAVYVERVLNASDEYTPIFRSNATREITKLQQALMNPEALLGFDKRQEACQSFYQTEVIPALEQVVKQDQKPDQR